MNSKPFKFDDRTPQAVRVNLDILNDDRRRVRIFYGDAVTGTAWMEENDVTGTIGKSTGTQPIPLMIANSRSMGGGHLLDHCIVKIIDIASRRVLYEHPTFNNPADRAQLVTPSDMRPEYAANVTIDGEVHARFTRFQSAANWINFMQGKRFTK